MIHSFTSIIILSTILFRKKFDTCEIVETVVFKQLIHEWKDVPHP